MLSCSKCGNEEVDENSRFCNKCGSKLSSGDSNGPNRKKLVLFGGIGAVVLIAIGSTLVIIFNNPVTKFKNALAANQYAAASAVYNEKIKGNAEKEKKSEAIVKEDLSKIVQDFTSNSIDYQKATVSLETLQKIGLLQTEVNSTSSDVNKLNDSRTSFKKAQEFISNNNFKDGIAELKKVIEMDENYSKAKDLIVSSSAQFKTTALKDAEQFSGSTDYDKAIATLNDALLVIPNDADMSSKKASYEKLNEEKKAAERKKKMEEAKAAQEVVVNSAGIVVQSTEYKALYPDMLQAIIQNNSDKTVKNMEVSFLAFDSNDLPIKVKLRFSIDDGSIEFVGNAPNVNIVPKAIFGKTSGWTLDKDHGIKTALACVKDVEYYDGSKWNNPYYDYWLEEYKEKPLH